MGRIIIRYDPNAKKYLFRLLSDRDQKKYFLKMVENLLELVFRECCKNSKTLKTLQLHFSALQSPFLVKMFCEEGNSSKKTKKAIKEFAKSGCLATVAERFVENVVDAALMSEFIQDVVRKLRGILERANVLQNVVCKAMFALFDVLKTVKWQYSGSKTIVFATWKASLETNMIPRVKLFAIDLHFREKRSLTNMFAQKPVIIDFCCYLFVGDCYDTLSQRMEMDCALKQQDADDHVPLPSPRVAARLKLFSDMHE